MDFIVFNFIMRTTRSSHLRYSIKKVRPATLLKETLAQLFFCEFSITFKDTFFTEHLRTTAFKQLLEINQQ